MRFIPLDILLSSAVSHFYQYFSIFFCESLLLLFMLTDVVTCVVSGIVNSAFCVYLLHCIRGRFS